MEQVPGCQEGCEEEPVLTFSSANVCIDGL